MSIAKNKGSYPRKKDKCEAFPRNRLLTMRQNCKDVNDPLTCPKSDEWMGNPSPKAMIEQAFAMSAHWYPDKGKPFFAHAPLFLFSEMV